MANNRRRAIAVVVIVVLVLLQLPSLGAKKSKTVLKSKLGNLQRNIRVVKHRIYLKKQQKATVTGQLAVIEDKLDRAQDKLTENKMRLLDAQVVLANTVKRLAATEKRLVRHQALLRTRIVDIYEGEDLNYLDVVLGSTNMWTFLSRAYYLQRILHADTTLISQVRALKASIERDKALQAQKVSQIGSLQTQLVANRDEVQSNAEQKQRQIYNIEHDARLMARALAEMEEEEAAIEAEIRRAESTPMGQKMLNTAFKGGFVSPVSGRVTSRFGYRHHPITGTYKLHTGVDIACRTGASIRAAASGIVSKAGYNRAYGYMVVIQHNGGYSTLYGHCSRLLVSAGQRVSQGQVIARAGSTGWSTGPHLHYQLMKNGTPINPGR